MKQIVGYMLIICCIPLLFFISKEIWNEIRTAQLHEQQIEEAIVLPEVTTPLPFILKDENGQIYSEEYVEWREPMPLSAIPEMVKNLFLYSEDEEFFNHIGFDLSAIARAFIVNTSEQSVQQGGSTITQQLVRMRYLSEEKTYERKLMELFYSYELEKIYDKETILEMYLNEIYFSNQVYGIGSAATYYFNKPLAQLTLAEMAFIAAIPNNPTLYDPLKHFDKTKARQERLLDKLAEKGILSAAQAKTEKQSTVTLHVKEKIQQYPSYSTYVLQELKWLIAQNEGLDVALTQAVTKEEKEVIHSKIQKKLQQVLHSGVVIHTALDPDKQAHDEQAINDILSVPDLQASAVVIDNNSREIKSIYGGKNYEKFDLHRAYQSPRQPGSSFKPLIVYAPYFETTNYTPAATVSGGAYCVGNFCPKNYGGGLYGYVTLETAFKYSYNTSALRLLNTIGLETAFSYINRFHFQYITPKDYTYASALGGLTYGVTALEMADAYTSFIDGSHVQAHAIRKVTDLQGNKLYSWPSERDIIWSTKTVQYIRSMMHEVVRSGTGVGLYTNTAYIGAKTGTTNEFKDFWVAGLTETETAAVWIGYDTPRSMEALERYQLHFSIFNAITN